MEQNENTEEIVLEQENNQEVEIEETPTEEPSEEPKDEGVKLSPAEYRHFKKWEAANKQPAPKVVAQPQSASPSNNVEEAVLLAQGLDEDLISELKLRAPRYGGSLIKAQKDPNFIAVKERIERDAKSAKASMGASRGSGSVQVKKTALTPGLSREEHMALAKGL